MNRPPQWHFEEQLEPRPCVVDRVLEQLASVRWTFIIAAPFVVAVVLLLLKMAFDCAMGVCVP